LRVIKKEKRKKATVFQEKVLVSIWALRAPKGARV
jgi:hypothetical protein